MLSYWVILCHELSDAILLVEMIPLFYIDFLVDVCSYSLLYHLFENSCDVFIFLFKYYFRVK